MTPDIEHDLRETLAGRKGLPGRYFTDEGLFALEQKRVLARTWMCIGLSADVAAKGDLYPVTVLGLPLVLARDADSLRCFHNVCSHRGAVLVEQLVRGQIRIVCPYHSWSYTLRGDLTKTPHVAGPDRHTCPTLDTARLGLREVRCAEWANHVFINLSGDALPFEQWIAPSAARFADVSWPEMRRDAALAQRVNVAANWKIIVENFVESYHLPWVHKALNEVNPMDRHYQILGGHRYLGQGGEAYEGERATGALLPMFSGTRSRSRYEALQIFPNLILSPLPDNLFSIIALPQSAAHTVERVEFFFARDEALAEQHAEARRSTAGFIIDVNLEDIGIVEKVQRGRVSPAFEGGQFASAQEATSLQFQRQIAAAMLAEEGQLPETLVELPTQDISHP